MLRTIMFLYLGVSDIVSLKEVPQMSKYGCEGTNMTIDCEENEAIQIVRANYGRFSLSICNPGGVTEWDYNCMQRRSKSVLDRRYENETYASHVCITITISDVQILQGVTFKLAHLCLVTPVQTQRSM